MVFFKDFGKTINDLFKDSKYKLQRTLEVTAANDCSEWKTKTVISDKGKMKNELVYKQSDRSFGTVEVTVPTQGNMEINYTTPKLMDGLKTNVVVAQPNVDLKAKYCKGSIKTECKATLNTATTSLDTVYVDASIGIDGFYVGGAMKVKPGAGNMSSMFADYNVGFQYNQSKNTTFSVSTANTLDKISTGFWRRYSDNGEVSARYNLDLNDKQSTGAPSVEIGGRWKIDDKGTLQAVVRTAGDAMFLYKHRVSDRVTASLGTCLDTKSFSADSTKVHYKLEFSC